MSCSKVGRVVLLEWPSHASNLLQWCKRVHQSPPWVAKMTGALFVLIKPPFMYAEVLRTSEWIRLLLPRTCSRCTRIFGKGYVPLGISSVFFRPHGMYDEVRWRATRGFFPTTNRGKDGCGWLFHSFFLVVGTTCIPTTHVMHPSSMYVGGIHGKGALLVRRL